MRVVNWSRWQRAKATVVGLLFLTSIILIGGLEGTEPTPDTWPLAILTGIASVMLFNNIIKHDERLHPERYPHKYTTTEKENNQ
jgi:hypothetical protein